MVASANRKNNSNGDKTIKVSLHPTTMRIGQTGTAIIALNHKRDEVPGPLVLKGVKLHQWQQSFEACNKLFKLRIDLNKPVLTSQQTGAVWLVLAYFVIFCFFVTILVADQDPAILVPLLVLSLLVFGFSRFNYNFYKKKYIKVREVMEQKWQDLLRNQQSRYESLGIRVKLYEAQKNLLSSTPYLLSIGLVFEFQEDEVQSICNSTDLVSSLERLQQLHMNGALTDQEFQIGKNRLLNVSDPLPLLAPTTVAAPPAPAPVAATANMDEHAPVVMAQAFTIHDEGDDFDEEKQALTIELV